MQAICFTAFVYNVFEDHLPLSNNVCIPGYFITASCPNGHREQVTLVELVLLCIQNTAHTHTHTHSCNFCRSRAVIREIRQSSLLNASAHTRKQNGIGYNNTHMILCLNKCCSDTNVIINYIYQHSQEPSMLSWMVFVHYFYSGRTHQLAPLPTCVIMSLS